eukprot:2810929-Pleurochrysis_carterae.AAC.1
MYPILGSRIILWSYLAFALGRVAAARPVGRARHTLVYESWRRGLRPCPPAVFPSRMLGHTLYA